MVGHRLVDCFIPDNYGRRTAPLHSRTNPGFEKVAKTFGEKIRKNRRSCRGAMSIAMEPCSVEHLSPAGPRERCSETLYAMKLLNHLSQRSPNLNQMSLSGRASRADFVSAGYAPLRVSEFLLLLWHAFRRSETVFHSRSEVRTHVESKPLVRGNSSRFYCWHREERGPSNLVEGQ